ncbi:MAG: hypothetical protein V7785_05860 [Bermanella sp.]
MKALSKAVAVASLLTAGVMSSQVAMAEAEVSASAAASNMYLWRGLDLGAVSDGAGNTSSTPAISADLSVSMDGAYAGVWTSSGDAALGQEYDLYAGYGLEAGGVSIDASVWTYIYPSGSANNEFDLTELIIGLGYGDASFTLYENITSNASDYRYMTLGYGMADVSATVGISTSDDAAYDYTHVDISYAATENLSFTFSQIVAQDTDDTVDESGKVVATLSLPIK